jgi:hypothetical protein
VTGGGGEGVGGRLVVANRKENRVTGDEKRRGIVQNNQMKTETSNEPRKNSIGTGSRPEREGQ